jgi:hypothetical protein
MSIKKGNFKKFGLLSILLVSSILTLFIGFTFMIVYWMGEQFGFAPVITLGTLGGFTSGEVVIIYVMILMGCIFLGSFLVLYLLKRHG